MVDYNKRLVEVDEVLKYFSKEDLLKIPEEIKQIIKENKDENYIWKYDETKTLKEQGLSEDTLAILAYFNMEFLLNDEQKELMKQFHEFNERKIEEQKKEQYKVDDLFENRQNNEKINVSNEEVALVVIKKESFFKKMINKIKSIFKK